MKKEQIVILVIPLILFGLLLTTPPVQAQTGLLPFGGIVAYREECTCNIGTTQIWFEPLYLGGDIDIFGPVDYSAFSTTLYADFNIGVSGLWHLGDYTPFVESCLVLEGEECILYPSLGLMSKVGTNE